MLPRERRIRERLADSFLDGLGCRGELHCLELFDDGFGLDATGLWE